MTLSVDRRALIDILSNAKVLQTVFDFSEAMEGFSDTEPLLEQLLKDIEQRIPFDYGAALLAKGNDGELDTAASRGPARRVDSNVTGNCFADRTASLIRTPVSIACAPLIVFDTHLGVIYLESSRSNAFDRDDLQLLIAVANAAAPVLNRMRHVSRLETENRGLRHYAYLENWKIVGDSRPIRELRDSISRIAASDSTVLVLGESGTGKELVARSIHENSRRKDGPFIALNCAEIVDTLRESELFGHERGAFTGAVELKKGSVESASGGTLFLDEVAELSLQTQAALLRFLQEREFRRVGGTKTYRADVRLVAATNRNLEEWVAQGRFRHDLYYRLQVIELRTPSLREVREDIPLLAEHFRTRFRHIRPEVTGFSAKAMEALMACAWMGNVRQLQNSVEHAMSWTQSAVIGVEDLPSSVTKPQAAAVSGSYETRVAAFKRELVERALAEANGDFEIAAAKLELTSSYLYRLVQKLRVKRP